LPFSATELALPPTVAKRVRKAAGIVDPPRPRRPATKTAASKATATRTAASTTAVTRTAASGAASTTAARPKAVATKAVATKAVATKAVATKAAPAKAAPAKAAPAKAAPAKAARAKSAAGQARRKPLAPIALTVAFDGARWTVEARSGTRRVRPVEVPAAAAAAATTALGVPEALALVSAVTDAMRLEAEQRAAALREQLAAAEAELAHFRRA
jgi:hypothetical protein